jgi:hypothetical protein
LQIHRRKKNKLFFERRIPNYHGLVHKELIQKSSHGSTKKYIEKMKKRKSYYEKSKLSRKQLFKQKPVAPPDEHYGTEATQILADMRNTATDQKHFWLV